MINLKETTLKILKKHMKDLQSGDLFPVYYELSCGVVDGRIDPSQVGAFTSYVISKGYDPLQGFDFVPHYYLANNTIEKTFIVPEGTSTLFHNTAGFSVIETLVLPTSIREIKDGAFLGARKLSKIIYKGTLEEFIEKVYVVNLAFYGCEELKYLECSDREISIDAHSIEHL